MAQTPEGKVKQRVKRVLDAVGAQWFMPVAGRFGRAGVSDFVACVGGVMVCIETKAARGRPTALQLRWLDGIAACGGVSVIVWPDRLLMYGRRSVELTCKCESHYKALERELRRIGDELGPPDR